MEHYAGFDVSLELTSMCLVDAQGQVVREAKVAREPDAPISAQEVRSELTLAFWKAHS